MGTLLRQPSDFPPPRRAGSWLSAMVLLAMVCAIAGLMYYSESRGRSAAPDPVLPGRADDVAGFGPRMRSLRSFTPGRGDQPLNHEPAGIAPLTRLPRAKARRETGFLRKQRFASDAVSVWTVSGVDVGDLAAFYNGQAEVAGFTPLPSRHTMRLSMMRRYSRETAEGTQILTVRLVTAEEFEQMQRRQRERRMFRATARRNAHESRSADTDQAQEDVVSAFREHRDPPAQTIAEADSDFEDPTIDAGGKIDFDDGDDLFEAAPPDAIRVVVILRSPLVGP